MAWEPTLGKWADEENFVIREPAWLRMRNASARYGGPRTRALRLLQRSGIHEEFLEEFQAKFMEQAVKP